MEKTRTCSRRFAERAQMFRAISRSPSRHSRVESFERLAPCARCCDWRFGSRSGQAAQISGGARLCPVCGTSRSNVREPHHGIEHEGRGRRTSTKDEHEGRAQRTSTKDEHEGRARRTSTKDEHEGRARRTSTKDEHEGRARRTSTKDEHEGRARRTSTKDEHEGRARRTSTKDEHEGRARRTSTKDEHEGRARRTRPCVVVGIFERLAHCARSCDWRFAHSRPPPRDGGRRLRIRLRCGMIHLRSMKMRASMDFTTE